MRVVCMSCTHQQHWRLEVPDGDVLIHAGDATHFGTATQLSAFGNWMAGLPHAHKVFVPGNHDRLFEKNPALARSLLPGVFVLIDEELRMENLRIYGTPWTKPFMHWSFMTTEHSLREIYQKIPAGTDILVTHNPPHGLFDLTIEGGHEGSPALARRVEEVRPRLHVFGHIHEAAGIFVADRISVNACVTDETSRLAREPFVIDI